MRQRRILIGAIGLALVFALWVGWNSPARADLTAPFSRR